MDPEKSQERQSFRAAVQTALDTYYSDLVGYTDKHFEKCCKHFGALSEKEKISEAVDIGLECVEFEQSLQTLFDSLLAHLKATVVVNNQNHLTPEDAVAFRNLINPTTACHDLQCVDLKPPEGKFGSLSGFFYGATGGFAIGLGFAGVGAVPGAIIGGLAGFIGGEFVEQDQLLKYRIQKVRSQIDSYLSAVKAVMAPGMLFILEKCLRA